MDAPLPTRSPVRVFVADDSPLIRARVRSLLEGCAMEVVGEGAAAGDCIDGIAACRPDVVVLDVQLEDGSGLEVLRALHPSHPGIAFVVFSNNASPVYRKRYLRAGAVHFLDKSSEFDRLPACVAAASSGPRRDPDQ